MRNKFSKKITLLAFSLTLPFMFTSCEYFVDVDYGIITSDQDTLIIQSWQDNGIERIDTIPRYYYIEYLDDPQTQNQYIVYHCGTMGGPNIQITEEESFARLRSSIDSIRIVRKADNASTITYRGDDNATDAQRYFFTREAWDCDPEGENEKSRTYTLKITDEMFQ